MKYLFHMAFVLSLATPALANEAPIEQTGCPPPHYRTVRVTDGDTAVLTDGNIKFKLRIAGLDAPESKQPYGKLATNRLKTLLEGKTLTIQPIASGLDMYGRVLGLVFVDGKDVALTMIREGEAFYYRPKCRDYPEDKDKYDYDPRGYVAAEAAARQQKLGIWREKSVELACTFRKQHRQSR